MEVNSVIENLGLTRNLNEPTTASQELDQNTFLRLFITQLENQDPLDPTANEEFVAQLAQFSSLEQATQTTSLLEQLIAQGNERGRLESVSLIGHEVLATGNTVEIDSDGEGNVVYQLTGESASGTLAIMDLGGNLVRTINLEAQGAGQQTVKWDGLNNQEEPVPPGVYQYIVNSINADGKSVGVTTFLRESVKSATWVGGQSELVLASGRSLSTDDVISVF
ncbi:flagellar hook assembly protein FlgD [Candidatus Nitronereus thalassa]|uniref:Basal-body rod modification protein FlgD n=1 Tax=Candidatus Nitronereus thalassa TaxID=3020898 RepID=A0ABU3K691_9BACT|nr:flagellar hook capping FlgD N-terminal domain-containing protein [Candidatus Nitronereus thalassa]MDT7041913.1 flagellar hook capping FlgD N-terminal domain-containing protein [Candidatus Nitronereus thalassa]